MCAETSACDLIWILFEHRVFAGGIKIKIKMGLHWIGVGPKFNEGPCKRQERTHRHMQIRRPWEDGVRDWGYAATSQGGLGSLSTGRGRKEPSEGAGPGLWTFGLQTVRE